MVSFGGMSCIVAVLMSRFLNSPSLPSIPAFPGRLYNEDGHIVIETDDYEPITSARVLFFPENTDTPSQSFLIEDVREVKKGGVKLPRSVLGWAAGARLPASSRTISIMRLTAS